MKANLRLTLTYEQLTEKSQKAEAGQLIAMEVLDEISKRKAALENRELMVAAKKQKADGQLTADTVENAKERQKALINEAETAADAANRMAKAKQMTLDINQEEAMRNINTRIQYFERQLDAVFRAGFRLKMVGMDLKFAGDRALGFIDQSVQQFADFEYTLGRAAGTMGDWALSSKDASANFSILQQKVLDASVSFKLFSAEETAQALYFLGSTKIGRAHV